MIEANEDLALPAGYDLEVLKAITWTLGSYDEEKFVTGKQAHELAQIGHELLQSEAALSFLTHEQKPKIEYLIKIAPQD